MNLKGWLISISLAAVLFVVPFAWAQENPSMDRDMQEMLKQAQELGKQTAPAKPVDMSKLKKQAAAIQAQEEKEETEQKKQQQVALQKQLAEPGPSAFPDWTPATPQFHSTSALTKKIVDDEVRVIQSGTSPLAPEEILKSWEAAVADKPLNHTYNRGRSNGSVNDRLDVSTRTDPVQRVRLEASRDEGEKITQVTIALILPKPYED
ncbi:MAG TPA: hypothetical protein VGI85_03825 [Chthoniobacterales bacterium]